MPKIQALQSEFQSQTYAKQVLPNLLQNNIPVVRSKVLQFTEVYQDDYHAETTKLPPEIAYLDFRHWYYPDEQFFDYIHRVATFELPAICLGESPYGFERPGVDFYSFEKKLYYRTKEAAKILRIKSPGTTLISPAIEIVDPAVQENCLDFFIHNRTAFDVYALHCVYDLKEQTLGLLTAFLNQVLHTLSKPVWVTQWAVPACGHSVDNQMSLAGVNWKATSKSQAAAQLHSGFRAIEEIAGKDTRWFFTGIDKDEYSSASEPPTLWDGYRYRANPPGESGWNASHFIGAVDYSGKLKTEVVEAFVKLCKDNE